MALPSCPAPPCPSSGRCFLTCPRCSSSSRGSVCRSGGVCQGGEHEGLEAGVARRAAAAVRGRSPTLTKFLFRDCLALRPTPPAPALLGDGKGCLQTAQNHAGVGGAAVDPPGVRAAAGTGVRRAVAPGQCQGAAAAALRHLFL